MPGPRPRTRLDDLTGERVLRVVESIPPGRVAAYGEVGAIVGVGPRLVGRIMGTWGSSVPWWRVTNSYGDHPLLARALPHWREEGIAVKPNGRGCRMGRFGADLERLRADAAPALAELEDATPDDPAPEEHAPGDSAAERPAVERPAAER
jgi:alkylated DNA nucleotide flippase Atl1